MTVAPEPSKRIKVRLRTLEPSDPMLTTNSISSSQPLQSGPPAGVGGSSTQIIVWFHPLTQVGPLLKLLFASTRSRRWVHYSNYCLLPPAHAGGSITQTIVC